MPSAAILASESQSQLLRELGTRLRLARKRRGLTASAVAQSAGITRVTLHRAERGEPAITLGTLIRILGALELATDIALIARHDKAGHRQRDAQLLADPPAASSPGVSAPATSGRAIRIERYPQLKRLAWHLTSPGSTLSPEEAFSLYERHWRHLDMADMAAPERALLKRLTASVGKGVLLV